MTKRIFRSIFLAAVSVLLAALVLVMGVLYSYFSSVQIAQLRIETALAAHAVSNEGAAYFSRLDDTMDCRITWIAADGTVLYDNRSDSSSMVNHLQRDEVLQALSSGYGQSARYSDTLTERYLYAAERLPDGSVLRLSASQDTVWNLVLGMWQPIAAILAAAVVLSLVLARRLSESIVRPLNGLNLSDPLSNREYEEIQPLLRRLDAQQRQLRAQSQELSRRQKEFNAITRSLNEGLVLMSASGTILSINPAAAQLLDITPNCLGADFSVANRSNAINTLVSEALLGEKAAQTVSLPRGDYLAVATPVRSEGSVSGVALLLFDVTEKQRAEQLRREFTANVSHELKTPLHAISGYAELMKSGLVAPEDTARFSGRIYTEAQRMIRLVEDILRLSRLDEGAADMQWDKVDLLDAAKAAMLELASAAELAGIRLDLTGSSTPVRAIPQLVSAIAFNLTSNAVKYNRPGGSVTLTVESREDSAVLTVSDTGIGIPAEHQDRVFERFYRVDKSHSKEVGGTGLGLSIVKHAALILGARIQLDSAPGQGTTVTVTFPK